MPPVLTPRPAGGGAGGVSEAEVQALVDAAVAALVDSSPAALDTLNELAAALGDDPNFAATLTTALAAKLSVVEHGANAATARPATSLPVLWVGTVVPNNIEAGDLVLDPDAATGALAAAAVEFDPTGLGVVTGDDLQTAVEELDAAVDTLAAAATAFGGWFSIDPVNYDPSDASAWSTLTSGVSRMGYTRDSATTIDSHIAYDLAMDAGDWKLAMHHRAWSDRGIYNIEIADLTAGVPGAFTTVATIDGYNAADTQNSFAQSPTFTIASGGMKRVRIRMHTKNASSSNYRGSVSMLWLHRVA